MKSPSPAGSITRSSSFVLATFVLVAITACQPASRSNPGRTAVNPPEVVTTVDVDGGEIWDVIHIADEPVGHQVTRWRTAELDGETLREVTARSSLSIRRFGQLTQQEMEMTSRETLDGRLVSFSSSISGGETPIRTSALYDGTQLQLTTSSSGKSQSWSLSLAEPCGGLLAVEFSLLREPMQAGDQRVLSVIIPVLNVVATVELRADGRRETELLDRTLELMQITSDTKLAGGQSIRTIMWCDAAGQVLKSSVPAMTQTTYRVSKDRALERVVGSFDLGDASIVSVATRLEQPHSTRQIRYRASLMNGDPLETFAATPYQKITRVGERTAEITVRRVRPTDDAVEADDPPTAADRGSSPVIQSDDSLIIQLAETIEAPANDSWAMAVAVEQFVHAFVAEKNFSTAFATAADVARQRTGDCTEHAVLTAALCRARQLPARVVVGLVYVPSRQGFGFHMWNEVWIEDRWIPIDATLGRGGVGAAHLALARTSLPAEESFSSFLQVVRVIGQLKIDVLSVD